MKFNYQLSFSGPFLRRMKKILKYDKLLVDQVNQTMALLKVNPFYPTLKTHRISHPIYGEVNSSKVNGDIRVLWVFKDGGFKVLNILAIGGSQRFP